MYKLLKQYKDIFFLSWIILYLLIPTWTLPVPTLARAAVYFGLLIYFYAAAYLLHRWTQALAVDKPFFMPVRDWKRSFQDNIWLVIICLIAAVLHIKPLLLPILILGDETIHLQGGLWPYEYINSNWQSYFQVALWSLIGTLLIVNLLIIRSRRDKFEVISSDSVRYIWCIILSGFLITYFILLKDVAYAPTLIRYPPVSKLLYFLTYTLFDIHRVIPRFIQLVFYLLCSIYLYRIINLYFEKEAALLGAVIYLFLPVTFAYAHLGELASGTIFFLVVISFYFIRYIKEEDSRDLLLTVYFIGIGCLYKKLHVLMFIICFAFLILYKLYRREKLSLKTIRVLLLSLVPIVPWMLLTKNFSWRNYSFQLSNLILPEGKIITYLPMMASNLSGLISVMCVLSLIYILFRRRNVLAGFFGLVFVVYYIFIVSDMGALSPRFSMVFYPTIIVFIVMFLSDMMKQIKWTYASNLLTIMLIGYLVIISAFSPFNERYLNILDRKLIYFQSEEAMRWVHDNVKEGEKILTIRVMSVNFYKVKYDINSNKIINFWYEIKEVDTPDKMRAYNMRNNVTYIIFPHSPKFLRSRHISMLEYLKDNPENEYSEVASFKRGNNSIIIYKVNQG
jgi:hypothetical protein